MQLLKEFLYANGLNVSGKALRREAVKAIILKGKALLMIHSSVNGDYKFPGGGINEGETHEDALAREIREECGSTLTGIERDFGKIVEHRKPFEEQYDVFTMTSFYYACQVNDSFGEQNLDRYEKELVFRPVWVELDTAIAVNRSVLDSDLSEIPAWTSRETFVLEHLRQSL